MDTARQTPAPALSPPTTSKRTSVFAAATLLILGLYIHVHLLASCLFPIPWIDEAHFLWQAVSFQQSGSLLSPALNPDRPILWMPPGYMIVTGLLFKILPVSLMTARHLSGLEMVAAFLLLLLLTRRDMRGPWPVGAVGFALLNTGAVVAGNMARMEALLLLVVLGGFLLLAKGRLWPALALLLMSPLIHPNGLYFVVAAACYALARRHTPWAKPTAGEWVWLLGAALAWAAYLAYVGQHWHWFLSDMHYQFALKGRHSLAADVRSKKSLLCYLLVAICLASRIVTHRPSVGLLLALALPMWLVNTIGNNFYYGVFDSVFYVLFCVILLEVAGRQLAAASGAHALTGSGRPVLLGVVFLALVAVGVKTKVFADPRHYPANLRQGVGGSEFNAAWAAPGVPYLDSAGQARVQAALDSLGSPQRPVTVSFIPAGDAFFFEGHPHPSWQTIQPLFHAQTPQITVVHLSRYLPQWQDADARSALGPAAGDRRLIRQDHGTETWTFVQNDTH